MRDRTMVLLARIVSVVTVITVSSVSSEDEMDWEGAEVSTNYESYHEPSCCSHRVRHYKDHVRELTCGKLYYRTFHLDPTRNSLYVGAMDRMIRVNLYNITSTDCKEDALILEPSNTNSCISKGKSENYDCRNHIRVIQPIGDGSRLYVCGTNAHNPKDWVVKVDVDTSSGLGRSDYTIAHLGRNEYVPGIGNAVAKCPFDPNDNSTAVWVENGNPGGLPALYSGTNAEFTKADSVIFRTDLYNLTTGKREYTFKRTLKYDSKWLDKPNFVGAYDIGEYVYFFFRETAVEYINCGKNIYSRVARICKKDVGGKNILNQNWATYVKARLNCSIAGEFPFYFNEIQAVYKVPGDDSRFYAVFTTLQNGLMGSAVCSYHVDDIQQAFLGKFKEQASSSSAWLPVISSRVPEPRPGMCVNDTTTLPDTVLNFIRSHPLMDEAVNHENSVPVFYKRDISFSAIVVDRVSVPAFGGDKLYTVYFVGTTEGRVYKIVSWSDPSTREAKSELLDVFDVTTPEPIRIMEISPKHKSFYAASDNRLKQVNLVMCTRYDSCLRCVRDPYCGWDKESNSCRPYSPGLLQDVANSSQGICEACIAKKRMVVSWGQSVHLACPIKGPEPLMQAPVVWYHYSKERGGQYPITFRPDKFIKTQEQGLVVLSVSETEAGRYDCRLGPDTLCSYNITVDVHRCSAPTKTHDYQRVYADWCKEFEKYKTAMTSWERRQSQCVTKLNQSSNQNNHPNDIFARSPLV